MPSLVMSRSCSPNTPRILVQLSSKITNHWSKVSPIPFGSRVANRSSDQNVQNTVGAIASNPISLSNTHLYIRTSKQILTFPCKEPLYSMKLNDFTNFKSKFRSESRPDNVESSKSASSILKSLLGTVHFLEKMTI